MSDRLAWKRFWCPRSGTINVSSGFLADPESEYAAFYPQDIVDVESISENPCLILLGEPGMGKSNELKQMFQNSPRSRTDHVLLRDLRQYDSTIELRRALFESSEAQIWRAEGGHLTLYLDSLDEALLEVRVLSTWLPDLFAEQPTDNLSLRIACRTAEWPLALENGLRRVWGEDKVRVFEIAPLREVDVRVAAESLGLDADAFLLAVRKREATALAQKPTTLDFLLKVYGEGTLPDSQADLYELGVRKLCEDHDPDGERQTSGRANPVGGAELLAIASRIAAATVFGNKAAIWQGPTSETPSTDVSIGTLASGSELVGTNHFVTLSESAVRNTLKAGLFSSRGSQRMGWAHQTYSEFLAARWVVQHRMPLQQIANLIRHPEDPDGKFVPQLYETIAWLAGMQPEVRHLVLQVDPEVLLRSDLHQTSADERAAIVDKLLHLEEAGDLRLPDLFERRRYERLKHPGLADQLRPWISNRQHGEDTRRLALELARWCETSELSDPLADLALDLTESIELRTSAVRIIVDCGTNIARARLLQLVTDPQSGDRDLKALALYAVWPNHLTVEQLFAIVTSPEQPDTGNRYDALYDEARQQLTPDMLLSALLWLRTEGRTRNTHRQALADEILLLAWKYLDNPDALDTVAEIVIDRYRSHRGFVAPEKAKLLSELHKAHPAMRYLLVEKLVERRERASQLAWRITHGQIPLLLPEDFGWILDRVDACAGSADDREFWMELALTCFDAAEPLHMEALYEKRQDPFFAPKLSELFGPVELDSAVAHRAKQLWQDHTAETEELRRELELMRADRIEPLERIRAALHEYRNNNVLAWQNIAYAFASSDDMDHIYWHRVDIVSNPMWKTLDPESSQLILEAAVTYLESAPCGSACTFDEPEGWAAYCALLLWHQQSTDISRDLTAATLNKWGRAVVSAIRPRPASKVYDHSAADELLRTIYRRTPDSLRSATRESFIEEDKKYGHIYSIDYFTPIWDRQFSEFLLSLVSDITLTPRSIADILASLFRHEVPEARTKTESLIPERLPRRRRERELAIVAAELLVIHTDDAGWNIVWPLLRKHPSIGRNFAISVARQVSFSAKSGMTEEQLADAYVWLAKLFPSQEPSHPGIHMVTPDDEGRRLRSDAFQAIEARATPRAVGALERLLREFPDYYWIKQAILRTRHAIRQGTWRGPTPEEVLELAVQVDRRFVTSEVQLLEILIESLQRFEADLHGPLPSVGNFWNPAESGFRPKEEEHLSDEIARHLLRDLRERRLVVGREVQIRRKPGERTDIYVEVWPEQSSGVAETLSVIIEVKGSWNRNVLGEMKTQLAGRYLARNPTCHAGLYVVGWYLSECWVNEDRKRRTRKLRSREELSSKLEVQAQKLTTGEKTLRAIVIDVALP